MRKYIPYMWVPVVYLALVFGSILVVEKLTGTSLTRAGAAGILLLATFAGHGVLAFLEFKETRNWNNIVEAGIIPSLGWVPAIGSLLWEQEIYGQSLPWFVSGVMLIVAWFVFSIFFALVIDIVEMLYRFATGTKTNTVNHPQDFEEARPRAAKPAQDDIEDAVIKGEKPASEFWKGLKARADKWWGTTTKFVSEAFEAAKPHAEKHGKAVLDWGMDNKALVAAMFLTLGAIIALKASKAVLLVVLIPVTALLFAKAFNKVDEFKKWTKELFSAELSVWIAVLAVIGAVAWDGSPLAKGVLAVIVFAGIARTIHVYEAEKNWKVIAMSFVGAAFGFILMATSKDYGGIGLILCIASFLFAASLLSWKKALKPTTREDVEKEMARIEAEIAKERDKLVVGKLQEELKILKEKKGIMEELKASRGSQEAIDKAIQALFPGPAKGRGK